MDKNFAKYEDELSSVLKTKKKHSVSKSKTREVQTNMVPLTDTIDGVIMYDRPVGNRMQFYTTEEGPAVGVQWVVLQSVGSSYYGSTGATPRLLYVSMVWYYPGTDRVAESTTVTLKLDSQPYKFFINMPSYSSTPGFKMTMSSSGVDPFYVKMGTYSTDNCEGNIVMNMLKDYWVDYKSADSCGDGVYRFAGSDGVKNMKGVYVRQSDGKSLGVVPVNIISVSSTGTSNINSRVDTTSTGLLLLGFGSDRSARGSSVEFRFPSGTQSDLQFKFY